MGDEKRKLTDSDIKALAREIKNTFYNNLGKGVWSLAWKAIIMIIIALSLYGAGVFSLFGKHN